MVSIDLLLRHAIFARLDEVRPELVWTVQGNQRGHSHQASVTLRQLRTLPDVAVQHVVSQLGQFGGKVADRSLRRPRLRAGVGARSLSAERRAVLRIADLLHPFDGLAVELFG